MHPGVAPHWPDWSAALCALAPRLVPARESNVARWGAPVYTWFPLPIYRSGRLWVKWDNMSTHSVGWQHNAFQGSGSRPTSKTWRFFYFGDLWAEGLLASLTYINGPSGFTVEIRYIFQMNIRTIQLNGLIQCKILFSTSGPDFVIISTTFMWYFRKDRAALGEHCIPFQDGVQKSDFVT